MRVRLIFALLLSLTTAFGFSQVTTGGAKSDEINLKLRQIDVMIQLVPLALTKTQLDKILPVLEKLRSEEKAMRANEDKLLAEKEAATTKVWTEAIEKGVYPPRTYQQEIAKLSGAIGIRRSVFANECADRMVEVVKASLNAGQMKAMVNSLEPNALNPQNPKAKDMTEEQRIRFFVRAVWLDPYAYDVLVKMRKFIKD